jgi:hypothetical protein
MTEYQARVLEKAVAAWESLTGTQLTGNRQTMLTIPRRTSVESWPSSARGARRRWPFWPAASWKSCLFSSKTGFPMRLTPATMGD